MPFQHQEALTEFHLCLDDEEAKRIYWSECGELSINQLESVLPKEYSDLITVLRNTDSVTDYTIDFIIKLLGIQETYRLGSGNIGIKNLKSHLFFRGIEWNLLEQKISTPPYIPQVLVHPNGSHDKVPYISFQHMISEVNKSQGLELNVREEEHRYFDTWYVFKLCVVLDIYLYIIHIY